MKATLRMALAVVCILIIAVCAVLIVQKSAGRARIDLTQHGSILSRTGRGTFSASSASR